MQGPAMAGPAAAEGTGPVAGPAATDRGLFAGIQTPAQALEVTGCCLHALTDLELHVLQQPGHVGAVGALLDWTNAAWHREVVAAQAVLLATGPAAVAAAVAAAKARRPSPSEPAQLALLLLDKLLLLVTQALSRADADVSVSARCCWRSWRTFSRHLLKRRGRWLLLVLPRRVLAGRTCRLGVQTRDRHAACQLWQVSCST